MKSSEKVTEVVNASGELPVFFPGGITQREWLEGTILATLSPMVQDGKCSTWDAATTAISLARMLLRQRAYEQVPKMPCSVCQAVTFDDPCDECA